MILGKRGNSGILASLAVCRSCFLRLPLAVRAMASDRSPSSWTPPKARRRQNNDYQHKPVWSAGTMDMEEFVFPSFQGRGERTSIYGSSSGKPTQATQSAVDPIADLKELEALEDLLNSAKEATAKAPLPTPKEISAHLDEFIVGQKSLKKAISVAIYNHYKRLENNIEEPDWMKDVLLADLGISATLSKAKVLKSQQRAKQSPMSMAASLKKEDDRLKVEKSNVLLVGPTGCGKTLIARTTAKILDVPFSMNDATPFTQAGYVGEDVENCVMRLLQNANYDVKRAERGIIFIDEIDKISRKTDASNPNQRDVTGEGVQQGLLRILEGTNVNINVKPGQLGRNSAPQGESFTVDTTNILFICSGAFTGLDKIVQNRKSTKASIGFGLQETKEDHQTKAEILDSPMLHVEQEDLIQFGLIPEFVGRLPVIAGAQALNGEELVQILTKPKNAIVKQYQEIFRRSDIQLFFHKESMFKVAEQAIVNKTGARGLRRILESLLNDALFEFPGTEIRYAVVDAHLKVHGFAEERVGEALKMAGKGS